MTWHKACDTAGVPRIPLYEGTKHTFATHLSAEESLVQAILGHKDSRSTRRHRQLRQEAVTDALRPRTRDS